MDAKVTASWAERLLVFEVSIRRDGSQVVLEPRGELDLATAPQLESALVDALASERTDAAIVNLAQLEFLDLAGLRALRRCARLACDRGVAFELLNVTGQPRLVFELWDRASARRPGP